MFKYNRINRLKSLRQGMMTITVRSDGFGVAWLAELSFRAIKWLGESIKKGG